MKRVVLITGVAGFIGSWTAEAFLARGDTVVGLDNLNNYYSNVLKRRNLDAIMAVSQASDDFTFFEGDIRDRHLIAELFSRYNFDVVIHLAAMAGVRASIDDPALYYGVNVDGTLNLLDATVGRLSNSSTANQSRTPCKFIFASTSSVYGATSTIPFIETDPCDRPLVPYSASKRAVELLGYTYHHVYDLPFIALRFFTVYGPRNRPDMMAFKIAESLFTGKTINLHDNGQMHRDWTYVTDIVQGIVAAADRSEGYQVMNLGRGQPILLADFVGTMEELSGRKAVVVSTPAPVGDIPYTYANTDRARSILGYNPTVSVREGVWQLLKWYEHVVHRP